jgi:hypothetical protein
MSSDQEHIDQFWLLMRTLPVGLIRERILPYTRESIPPELQSAIRTYARVWNCIECEYLKFDSPIDAWETPYGLISVQLLLNDIEAYVHNTDPMFVHNSQWLWLPEEQWPTARERHRCLRHKCRLRIASLDSTGMTRFLLTRRFILGSHD